MTSADLRGTTTGGLPFPESTGPLNQGANDIKALALAVDSKLTGTKLWQSVRTVATFDANGLWYVGWAAMAMGPWAARPACLATAEQTTVGGDAGVNVQIYSPHTDAGTCVLQANYVKDGRAFSGNIAVAVMASGTKA